ncbi:MAG: AlpA family phage regulatory protein [Sulfuritalea sp.]|nr:AlpA family phage regulatory protein [Sulfuritalea sp.]
MAKEIQEALTILRRKQVEAITGLSRSAIYDKLDSKSPRHDPTFPKQVRIGWRSVGFIRAEVEEWLARCVASSRGGK